MLPYRRLLAAGHAVDGVGRRDGEQKPLKQNVPETLARIVERKRERERVRLERVSNRLIDTEQPY